MWKGEWKAWVAWLAWPLVGILVATLALCVVGSRVGGGGRDAGPAPRHQPTR